MINLQQLIDDAKCFAVVRELRCPAWGSGKVKKRGYHTHQAHRQRYQCQTCGQQFDDLSGTIFEGHHQPLRVWVLCLYLMGSARRGSHLHCTERSAVHVSRSTLPQAPVRGLGVDPAEILTVGLNQSRRYTSILPRAIGTKH